MPPSSEVPSARRAELLESAYRFAVVHGLGDISLRPLATAIGSSPRVLLYLFGSKEGLVRALLDRARADELDLLGRLRTTGTDQPDDAPRLAGVVRETWAWLSDPEHHGLLVLWVETYGRSLIDPGGAWAGFGRTTVEDWLGVLAQAQPGALRNSRAGQAQRTLALAVLRGCMLDLLATGDRTRVTAALNSHLAALSA